MPNQPVIAINPPLLAWGREESGYGVDRVAKRLQVTAERVTEWETGERQPTLRQVENLARFFHAASPATAAIGGRVSPFAGR